MTKRTLLSVCVAACTLAAAVACTDKKHDGNSAKTQGKVLPPAPTEPPPARADMRVVAFAFGTQLATVAMQQADAAPAKALAGPLRQMRLLAKLLAAPTPAFPAPVKDANKSRTATRIYLRDTAGKTIAASLTATHGKQHAALFALAVEAHLLRVSYDASAKDNADHAAALAPLATAAGIPTSAIEPTATALRESQSKQLVTSAFRDLRLAVNKHLKHLRATKK